MKLITKLIPAKIGMRFKGYPLVRVKLKKVQLTNVSVHVLNFLPQHLVLLLEERVLLGTVRVLLR